VNGGIFAGSGLSNSFFLKNNGFFSETTAQSTAFERVLVGGNFSIDFSQLPTS